MQALTELSSLTRDYFNNEIHFSLDRVSSINHTTKTKLDTNKQPIKQNKHISKHMYISFKYAIKMQLRYVRFEIKVFFFYTIY